MMLHAKFQNRRPSAFGVEDFLFFFLFFFFFIAMAVILVM